MIDDRHTRDIDAQTSLRWHAERAHLLASALGGTAPHELLGQLTALLSERLGDAGVILRVAEGAPTSEDHAIRVSSEVLASLGDPIARAFAGTATDLGGPADVLPSWCVEHGLTRVVVHSIAGADEAIGALAVVVSGDEPAGLASVITEALDAARSLLLHGRRNEQAVRLERLTTAIDNLNDAVVISEPGHSVDQAPRVLFANPAASRILGRDADALLGSTTDEILSAVKGDPENIREARRRLIDGEPVRSVLEFETPSGSSVWVEVLTQPIDNVDPAKRYWVSVARDVTQRTDAERELAESRQRLRHAQKMEAVGRLAGGMAHDFNNLLTAMLGYGEFIAGEVEDEALRQDAQEIVSAAIRGQAITGQLLAFSRKSSWSPSTVAVSDVLMGIDRMVSRLVGEDVHVDVQPRPDAGWVVADPAQLEQAIVNLTINARDALRSGGSIEITAGPLDLAESLDTHPEPIPPGWWETIEVRDDGTGIAPGLLSHIFEPFFTTKAAGKGTGLGLSSVYGTVKQTGGYVSVESTPGEGSVFRLVLPRAAAPPETDAHGPDAASTEHRGTETLLVVEDETAVRNFTVRALERAGYTVIQAKHGADALLLWERDADRIDLILTDVVMPEMGGAELAEKLRASAATVPVLFMSGYTGGTTGARTIDGSIPTADLLQKPFGAPELLARVRAFLDRESEEA